MSGRTSSRPLKPSRLRSLPARSLLLSSTRVPAPSCTPTWRALPPLMRHSSTRAVCTSGGNSRALQRRRPLAHAYLGHDQCDECVAHPAWPSARRIHGSSSTLMCMSTSPRLSGVLGPSPLGGLQLYCTDEYGPVGPLTVAPLPLMGGLLYRRIRSSRSAYCTVSLFTTVQLYKKRHVSSTVPPALSLTKGSALHLTSPHCSLLRCGSLAVVYSTPSCPEPCFYSI